jgi:hypothetical protein
MSLHITRFVDRIKAAESRNQRDLMLSITEARDLHADITKLLVLVSALQENSLKTPGADTAVTVELHGGSF